MTDSDVFATEFEKKNKHYKLWYTYHVQERFESLKKLVHEKLGIDEYWDGSVDSLYDQIQKLNPLWNEICMKMFNNYVNYAKRIPPERALSWSSFREVVNKMADVICDDDELREELGLPPNTFEYVTPEMEEEEKTALLEKIEEEKQAWLKANKKKPLSEEEEAEAKTALVEKHIEKMKTVVTEQDEVMGDVDSTMDSVRFNHVMSNHKVMDWDGWDEVYRKYSVLDIPCEGKNVLLRLDLDVPMSEYTPPADEEDKEEDSSKLNKSSFISPKNTGRSKAG